MIIAQDGFRDEECFDTKKVLEQNNIEVTVSAPEKEPAFGSQGGQIMPDLGFEQIQVSDYDGICLIGGGGSMAYYDNEFVLRLVKDFDEAQKLISAICFAPAILAKAGVLAGKKVTAHEAATQQMKENQVDNSGADVEADGRIITANGPASATKFGQTIADYLKK